MAQTLGSMAVVSVRIPQIGEGLQEARLVAVLKQPGDAVRRDEPIYQMETDKAVMDVESPYEGTLVEWLGNPDDVLAIGAEVARMEVAEGVEEVGGHSHGGPVAEAAASPVETASTGARNANIPPRTRAYAKEKGITDDQLASIPAAGSKLMPEDIDAFLGGGAPASGSGYTDTAISGKQRILNSRLQRGNQLVVPGTMSVVCNWSAIERKRATMKAAGGDFQPSAFTMFAFAVVQALKEYPAFRSSLVGDSTLRTFDHVNLGIAVGLPGDELVLAVVERADTLSWEEFAAAARERIDLARTGVDQASDTMPISLTNMQSFGLRDAVPVVVPPSVATLFIGEVYNGLSNDHEAKVIRCCNLGLTFDHRVANGVGAAQFLNKIRELAERIDSILL